MGKIRIRITFLLLTMNEHQFHSDLNADSTEEFEKKGRVWAVKEISTHRIAKVNNSDEILPFLMLKMFSIKDLKFDDSNGFFLRDIFCFLNERHFDWEDQRPKDEIQQFWCQNTLPILSLQFWTFSFSRIFSDGNWNNSFDFIISTFVALSGESHDCQNDKSF
jgi:hypothetical protein